MMSVAYERVDRVAVLTLDRASKRNALDLQMFEGIREGALRAGSDSEVGAVVVRGAGGVFSSGIDVGLLAEGLFKADRATESLISRLQDSFTALEDLDKPVVALVEGHCFGAGLQLALACHVRAVAPGAVLSLLEARWGLVPDLGASHRLPRLVGLGRATEMALSARRISAEEAHGLGLAEILLNGKDPQDQVLQYAAQLALGPGALRHLAALFRQNYRAGREEALERERQVQRAVMEGPDFTEAVEARSTGREPRFVGR